ncbi:MAG: prolyl oligopeptidase family serine peptidase [archaeon]|nr:prolyl oligopeptidase family serine peptidase [archaeon]
MGTETAKNQEQKLYYHVLGTAQSEDALVFEDAAHPEWMFGAEVSDDGKYLIVTTNYSCEDLNRVHLVSLEDASLSAAPVALVDDFVASFGYITNEGSVFYFQSNLDAPRGSLLSVDISDPAALCNPRGWKAVLPQHPSDVLSHVSCVNQSYFVVIYMKDVVDRLYLHALDGQLLSEITLPSLGCVSGLSTRKKDAFFYFKFTSFAYPGTIFRHDFGEPLLHTHYQTVVEGVSPADFVAEQEWFASKDGTKIPMFVVRHKDVPRHGQQTPAYLYGYGGFNISIQPSFSTSQLFFMQYFRGILAIANIRGGGEYGEEWHHAGVKGHKQNVFDDFCAAAEYLVATKATVPSLLTISGGSNGGLLVGACMNQRPELFGCCVAHVGVFDMLQFHRFTIGASFLFLCTVFVIGCLILTHTHTLSLSLVSSRIRLDF